MKLFFAMLFAACTLAASTTGSAGQTTSTVGNLLKKLEESPMSMNYLNEVSFDNYKTDGFKSLNQIYLGYKIDKYHSVKLVTRFDIDHTAAQKKANDDFHTEYQNSQIRLYRSKILTQAEHGVNLSAQFRNYFNGDNGRAAGNDGAHRLYLTPSATFGKWDVSAGYLGQVYRKNTGTQTLDYFQQVSPGFAYSFTDNLAIGTSLDFYMESHNGKLNASGEQSPNSHNHTIGWNVPEISYNVGKASFALSAYFTMIESKDEFNGVKTRWHENGKVYASVYYTLF